MHGQEDILRERFTQQRCVDCGAYRRKEDVIILAHRSARWLLLVSCWRCQRRGIFIATFPRDDVSPPPHIHALDARDLPFASPLASPDPALARPAAGNLSGPITMGDVDAMRRFLTSFNGDFHALFGGEAG